MLGANLCANLYKTKKLMAPDFQMQFNFFMNKEVTSILKKLLDLASTVEVDRNRMKQIHEVKQRLIRYTSANTS